MLVNRLSGLYVTLVLGTSCLVTSGQDWPPHEGDGQTHADKTVPVVDKLPTSCDASHLLARQILIETEERAKLEERLRIQMATQENITRYQEELKVALNELRTATARPKDPLVAFSARVSSHLTGLSTSQTIIFGTLVTNFGDAYNAQTGIFRCPVDGAYQFYVSILSQPRKRVETNLAVNGEEGRLLLYSSSSGSHHGSLGSGTVILQLKNGDEVTVRLYRNFGDYIHCCWSTFSGHLLRAI